MAGFELPRRNQTGPNEWSDVEENDVRLKERIELLEGAVTPIRWYTPTVIAAEQTKTSTSYVTMETADEITGVVVPANGIVKITFAAVVKSSGTTPRVALFIGSTQLSRVGASFAEELIEAAAGVNFLRIATTSNSLETGGLATASTSGRVLSGIEVGDLAAGTYAISAKYKSATGSVTAKERILRVEVHGT